MSSAPRSHELSKDYEPVQVESRWYDFWDSQGYFHAEPDPSRESYCIAIPPPNVTGELHLGHAFQHTLHDILIRWKRMCGFNTLCVPGTDHAGIGTQRLVERALAAEGLTKHDLGREKFLDRAWQWTDRYGGAILGQLRTLGCSYDWRRTRFTLDDEYVKAVLKSFVDYYDRGWIYRGVRITNWCPSCQTALSDLEVEHADVDGHLWHVRYPFADGLGHVVVATTRPETMVGDTGVAIHPDDPRHAGEAGRTVLLPLMDREIPVVADPILVDPEFGTGAVKVTPAHDPNDFEAGRRNGLPQRVVIGQDGAMTAAAGRYAGLDRYEARRRIIDDLGELGLLEKTEPHVHAVAHCERCKTVLEPLLSEQWYLRMEELASRARAAIVEGAVRFVPDRYAGPAVEYLDSIRDWCISRQLWWGHRIPVHTCDGGHEFAAADPPDACPRCGSAKIEQDPDVLDTWFSSALWPFAVLGWPDESPDLDAFHPTEVLITDRQIIRLWVIRMIFSSLHFRDEIPFPDVYVHATVLMPDGKRMSKSKGVGIDPLDLIARFGADGTRFGLAQLATQGQDIRFSEERMEGARFFRNKLWNASRFVMLHAGQGQPCAIDPCPDAWRLEDRWICSRLQATIESVNEDLGAYNFDSAATAIYEFIWSELCDWYLELAKPRLQAGGEGAAHVRGILVESLETSLRLLHPFMPFVTEEIWQAMQGITCAPHDCPSIMVAPYPRPESPRRDREAESEFARVIGIVGAVRRLRADAGVQPGQRIQAAVSAETGYRLPEGIARHLAALARADAVEGDPGAALQPTLSVAAGGVTVLVPQAGLVDVEKESARLRSEIASIEKELVRVATKLGNEQFLARAPEPVVAKERAIERELEGNLSAARARLSGLIASKSG